MKYDPATNIFFVNFEGLHVRSLEDIEEIRTQTEAILGPLGRKVDAIVNYDNFSILPELVDDYADAVKYYCFDLLRESHPVHDQRLPANETGRWAEGAGVCVARL